MIVTQLQISKNLTYINIVLQLRIKRQNHLLEHILLIYFHVSVHVRSLH